MTRLTHPELNLEQIEREARQMRAEMLASAFRRFGAWLRKPRLPRASQTA